MLKDYVASELLGVLKVKPASEIIRFAKKYHPYIITYMKYEKEISLLFQGT